MKHARNLLEADERIAELESELVRVNAALENAVAMLMKLAGTMKASADRSYRIVDPKTTV